MWFTGNRFKREILAYWTQLTGFAKQYTVPDIDNVPFSQILCNFIPDFNKPEAEFCKNILEFSVFQSTALFFQLFRQVYCA